MRQIAISGQHETHYPIAETLWIVAGVVLLLAFGDSLVLLVLALATATVATAWWMHHRVDHGAGRKGHAMTMILPVMLAGGAALVAVLTLAAPAQAASIDSRFDICSALRNGTSLATIESTLEDRGYSARNAGTLTGMTIRQHCPDQAAGVMAQLSQIS